jgi:ketosteroid isomerase-like protein
MTDHVAEVDEFGRRWVAAEVAGDVDVLNTLAVKDFILVGPLGFVLDKEQWLDRYRSGDFVTSALDWRDTQVRMFGDSAIVVGVHDQEAAYRGQPSNGRFRATHILVREGKLWRLAGIHLSPITAPPGAGQSGG